MRTCHRCGRCEFEKEISYCLVHDEDACPRCAHECEKEDEDFEPMTFDEPFMADYERPFEIGVPTGSEGEKK